MSQYEGTLTTWHLALQFSFLVSILTLIYVYTQNILSTGGLSLSEKFQEYDKNELALYKDATLRPFSNKMEHQTLLIYI